MAGLFVGQTRETAARFSFLLSMPAIAASGLLELKEAITNFRKAVICVDCGDHRLRCCWLRVNLVSAAIPAHALYGILLFIG